MMKRAHEIVNENWGILTQAVELLDELSDQLYRSNEAWYRSGVGRHMRHVMDFYTAFLEGLPAGAIDYDDRARNPELETNRRAARDQLKAIEARVAGIDRLDQEVTCKNDGDRRDPASALSRSTVGRELQFLASHAVHHFAMVAMILDLQGFRTAPSFGVAPSTLIHRQRTGSDPGAAAD